MSKILTPKGWRELYLKEDEDLIANAIYEEIVNEISDRERLVVMKKDTEGKDKPTFAHSQQKCMNFIQSTFSGIHNSLRVRSIS